MRLIILLANCIFILLLIGCTEGESLADDLKCFNEKCRLPSIGKNSFYVTEETPLSSVLHLSQSLIEMHRKKSLKLCYEQGESILVSCSQGYVDVYNKSLFNVELTCDLNQGWLPKRCVFCEKVVCPLPQSDNKTYEVIGKNNQYGDVITYKCKPHYSFQVVKSYCQQSGMWSLPPPLCSPRCFKTIYLNSTSPLLDIFSPNYPENYPKSSQCQWKIESDRNWKIAIYIRDFRLEAGYYSASFCNYDKLTIKDGEKEMQLCGHKSLEKYLSSTNKITVQLQVDSTWEFRGFFLQVLAWEPTNVKEPEEPRFNTTLQNSIKVLRDSEKKEYNLENSLYFFTIVFSVIIMIVLFLFTVLFAYHIYTIVRTRCQDEVAPSQAPSYVQQSRLMLQRERAKAVYEKQAGKEVEVHVIDKTTQDRISKIWMQAGLSRIEEEEPALSEVSFNKDRTSMKSKVSFLIGRNKSVQSGSQVNAKDSTKLSCDDEMSLRERASIIAKKFTQILRSKDGLDSKLYEDSGPFLEVDAEKDQKQPPKKQAAVSF